MMERILSMEVEEVVKVEEVEGMVKELIVEMATTTTATIMQKIKERMLMNEMTVDISEHLAR